MIYCLIGPPAAGKTTMAQLMVKHLDNAIIVGRDPLREMLFGYKPSTVQLYFERDDFKELEDTITNVQDAIIKQALKDGKDVIVDNTHVQLKFINMLKNYNVPIKFIPVEADFETLLDRDQAREKSVGEDVIKKFFGHMEHLKKVFDFKDYVPAPIEPIVTDGRGLGGAFVFDLDGTLALNNSGRSPYHWKRVGEDDVNMPVKMVLDAIAEQGWDIIICSGRDSVCRPETEEWLDRHGIEYHHLFMRKEKDNRKDFVVKEELWREISKHYNIIAMFDDRQQVVDHGRALGFPVFQVAAGDF